MPRMSSFRPRPWHLRKIMHTETFDSTPFCLIFTLAPSLFITNLRYWRVPRCRGWVFTAGRDEGIRKICYSVILMMLQELNWETQDCESELSVGAETESLSAFSDNQSFMRALLKPVLKAMNVWRDHCSAFTPHHQECMNCSCIVLQTSVSKLEPNVGLMQEGYFLTSEPTNPLKKKKKRRKTQGCWKKKSFAWHDFNKFQNCNSSSTWATSLKVIFRSQPDALWNLLGSYLTYTRVASVALR